MYNHYQQYFLLDKLERNTRQMPNKVQRSIMVASSSTQTAFKISYCIHGYHVYGHVWDAALSVTLVCGRKATNEKYRYAFVVKKSGTTVGHVKISQV